MGKIIVVTSGKGGVGKTTVTANLGVGLTLEGKRVVMVDNDLGLRNLDAVLGLENRIVYDLLDVLEGNCLLAQALVKDPGHPGLHLLPAAQTRDKTSVTPAQMAKLAKELAENHDFVMMDCPAGIEHGFYNAIAGADQSIVVTNPDVSAVRDAQRVIGLLKNMDVGTPQLIVNRFRPVMARRGELMDVNDILGILQIELLGVIPEDDNVLRKNNAGEPAVESKTPAAQEYRRIVRRMVGVDLPITDWVNDTGWSALRRMLFGSRA